MKKGFTLIELLSVIVILGVLALIAAISVESIISDSKTDLSKIQKQKLEEAAEAFYITEGINDDASCVDVSELIQKGYIQGDSVTNPKTGQAIKGSVNITNNSNKYSYTYQSDVCEAPCYFSKDHEGCEMVTCGTESFYVMYDTADEVTMLAAYNLSTTVPAQDTTGDPNPTNFSSSNYWKNGGYSPAGDSEYLYVYDDNSTIDGYLSPYADELEDLGVNVIEARLMSYEEALELGCLEEEGTCLGARQWVYQTEYWLGSAVDNADVWHISSGAYISEDSFDYYDEYGIRPVITIPIDNIKAS